MNKKAMLLLCCCMVLSLSFFGCTEAVPADSAPVSSMENNAPAASSGDWTMGEASTVNFDESAAISESGVELDVSSVSKGYAAVRITSDSKLKFQVVFGETKYNYNLSGDGKTLFVPLQSGSGTYTFRVLENVTEDRYAELFSHTAEVALDSEFEPYLRPNSMVSFTADSLSTKKARELGADLTNDADFVSAVYNYLKENIDYDYEFADSAPPVYYPDPDATLTTGKGICFDYASTAAAMLRSGGVPVKLVTGYVAPDGIYHAWNMIYIRDKGWITVEIKADDNTWQLLDVTFAASNNQDSPADSSNYTQRYIY